ncbi:MAG: cache domain-containing protein [Deltaproteobacteria bacterium]|nr:cache domain-containing protein [Deltaproteobacteria bacterium]
MAQKLKAKRMLWMNLICSTVLMALLLSACPSATAESSGTCAREVLKAVVHSSGLSLSELLKSVPDENERTDLIRRFVRPVRFFPDGSGYIYVYTLDGVVVGHGGMQNLEGNNLIDHQDARGFYDVRKAIATAKQGGGFFEHYWQKPGQKGEFRKVTYVEPLSGTRCFIGAGAYVP